MTASKIELIKGRPVKKKVAIILGILLALFLLIIYWPTDNTGKPVALPEAIQKGWSNIVTVASIGLDVALAFVFLSIALAAGSTGIGLLIAIPFAVLAGAAALSAFKSIKSLFAGPSKLDTQISKG